MSPTRESEEKLSILPLKLEPCDLPKRLSKWHSIDYFKPGGQGKLFKSLASRATMIGAFVPPAADRRLGTRPSQTRENGNGVPQSGPGG